MYDDLDENSKELLEDLETFGILRKGSKFRHRDFATIAYIIGGCQEDKGDEILLHKLSDKDKDDILFKFLFPNSVLSSDGILLKDNAERSPIIEDFIRRSGNIFSQLSMFESGDRPKFYIPTRVMEVAEIVVSEETDDDISIEQVNALEFAKNHSIILKVFLVLVKLSLKQRIIIRQQIIRPR